MLWPFDTISYVVVTSNYKRISLPLHNFISNFATVINHSANMWYVGYLILWPCHRGIDPQVESQCCRRSRFKSRNLHFHPPSVICRLTLQVRAQVPPFVLFFLFCSWKSVPSFQVFHPKRMTVDRKPWKWCWNWMGAHTKQPWAESVDCSEVSCKTSCILHMMWGWDFIGNFSTNQSFSCSGVSRR